MLDVNQLIALRAVASEGSIAAAGRRLGYTRSSVSQQISALERSAGVALLLRSGRTVTLTPVGRRLLGHTERILAELRAAEGLLRQQSGEVSGAIRIGIPFREGPATMSSALTHVRHEFPRLEISLAATSDAKGPEEVRSGRLDVVILSRFGATCGLPEPGLRQWELSHDELRLCVPAEHPLAQRLRCSVPELAEEMWVLSPRTALGQVTLGLCAAAGFQPAVAATVDDMATALGLVSVGWGITIAPMLTPVGQEERLRRIPLEGVHLNRFSALVVRDGEEDFPEIRTVIEAVQAVSAR